MGDKETRRDALEEEMNGPTFWNDQEKAKAVIQEMKALNSVLKPFEELGKQGDDLQALIELAEEAGGDEFDDEVREASQRAGADFQEAYLRHVFNFIGITDIEFVRAEGIGMGPDQRAKALNDAHVEIETRLPVAA